MSDNISNVSASYPTAAQVARNKADVEAAIKQALTAINLRIRALELAAHFHTDDPVALASKIYNFIKQEESS